MTAPADSKSLTFVHGRLAIGGIEQLIVRFAEVLVRRGWRVQFVLQARTDTALDRRAAQIGEIYLLPTDYREAWPHLRRTTIAPTSFIFAPTSDAYVLAHLIRPRLMPEVRIMAGVYFPLEYANRQAHRVYEIGLAARLLRSAPGSNVIFMNESCRRATAVALGRSFRSSSVVPVPVDLPQSIRPLVRPAERLLVSVGRLVDFKGYPFGAISALRELADEGRPFRYDIYGEGPTKGLLEATIAQQGLEASVRVRGELEPHRFAEVCIPALAFLGMGTAAVEAAGLGVPTVLAAVGESGPWAHGWFADARDFDVGEVNPGQSLRSMSELLRHIADVDDSGYADLALRGRRRAESFALPSAANAFESALLGSQADGGEVGLLEVGLGWLGRILDSRYVRGRRPPKRASRYHPV